MAAVLIVFGYIKNTMRTAVSSRIYIILGSFGYCYFEASGIMVTITESQALYVLTAYNSRFSHVCDGDVVLTILP